MYSFTLDIEPIACPRPRATAFKGRARLYMPKNYNEWTRRAIVQIKDRYEGPRISGAVMISITAIFKRPQRLLRKKDPANRFYKASKPDIDNICKAVIDSLVKAGVFVDDNQIVTLTGTKLYGAKLESKKSEREQIKIDIYPIEVPPCQIQRKADSGLE